MTEWPVRVSVLRGMGGVAAEQGGFLFALSLLPVLIVSSAAQDKLVRGPSLGSIT